MRIRMLTTAVWLTLLGTVALGQKTTYDYNREVDFSKYTTYGWTRGIDLADELNHARVVRAIDAALAAKGLAPVGPDAHPDLLVAYHASFEKNLEIHGLSRGWGPPGLGGDRWGTATVQQLLVGTLVVDISDAATGAIVWRSLATSEVTPTDKPETRDKKIAKSTEKMFRNYPPKP